MSGLAWVTQYKIGYQALAQESFRFQCRGLMIYGFQ